MGSLKPNATYVYERVDGTVYAREFGSNDRFVVGYDCDENSIDMYRKIAEQYVEDSLWQDIREAAKTNSNLQEALERVKIIYHLSKNDEQ
jgi:hypothetical protein